MAVPGIAPLAAIVVLSMLLRRQAQARRQMANLA